MFRYHMHYKSDSMLSNISVVEQAKFITSTNIFARYKNHNILRVNTLIGIRIGSFF